MAFSSERVGRFSLGGAVLEVYTWNAASVTSGTVNTSLSTILAVASNNEVTEDVGKWVCSGANVAMTGVTSDDTGTLIVIGR